MYPASVEYLNRQRIIPKLRQWTLGATVDFGFAVCDWVVSDFEVYLSIVLTACYHWWICLLVWLSLLFFNHFLIFCLIFLKFFILITFYFILFYFFLSFFFLPFLLSQVADRVLVLRPGVRPEPLRWESQVQDWTTRDLPAPRNINWWGLSQMSPSQC